MVSPPNSVRDLPAPSTRRPRFEDEDRGRNSDDREPSRTRQSSRPPDARRVISGEPSPSSEGMSFASAALLFDSGLQSLALSPSSKEQESDYSDDFEQPRVARTPTPPVRSGAQRSPTPPTKNRAATLSAPAPTAPVAPARSPPPTVPTAAPTAPVAPVRAVPPTAPTAAAPPTAPTAAPVVPVRAAPPTAPAAAPAAPVAPVRAAPQTAPTAAPAAPVAPVRAAPPTAPTAAPAAPVAPVRAAPPTAPTAAPAAPVVPVRAVPPTAPTAAPAAPVAPVRAAPPTAPSAVPAAPTVPTAAPVAPVRAAPVAPALAAPPTVPTPVPAAPVRVAPPTAPTAAPTAPVAPVRAAPAAPVAPAVAVPPLAPTPAPGPLLPVPPVEAVPAPALGLPAAPLLPTATAIPIPPPLPPPPDGSVVEARKDDEVLSQILGFSPKRRQVRKLQSRVGRKLEVFIQHRLELCTPLCHALSLPDLVLNSDVVIAGVLLKRGMQLVMPKSISFKSLARSRDRLLDGLMSMKRLLFIWPEHLEEESNFITWWWKCPKCRFPYPIQAPEALCAVALLRSALPKLEQHLEPPARDLWALSGLLTVTKTEHQLEWLDNSFAAAGKALCCSCGHRLSAVAYRCRRCELHVCQLCELRSRPKPLCCPPGPAPGRPGIAYSMLSSLLETRFDVSPILDFGSIARLGDVPEAEKLLKRNAKGLERLQKPAEYYARAAVLQALAQSKPAEERRHLLHEACVALQECMRLPGPSTYNLYKIESGDQTRPCMEKDARVWYLLGLILCDLGSFEEARKAYRQALCRLPMYYFSHAIHYNLALLRSRDSDAGACAASKNALGELQRSCGAPRPDSNSKCWICGR